MATKQIAWNTGNGNITLTYQGQGDGTISVQSDANNLGSARSQVITVETVGGAITRGFTINQAACPFPVGDVKNFSYTGSYQEAELPAGQYKLQCWGAQGGSNAAASSYGITAKAGGKGGYSEGIITLSQKTTVRIYVGGQGSSSAGGFNGGGSTTGSASYNSDNEQGVSRMGGGGGATDIRLSDGALLSRMIVAGGGAGGAMCYRGVTSQKTASHSWNPSSSGTLTHASVTSTTDWDISSTVAGKIVRMKINNPLPIYIGGTSKGTLTTSYILFDFRNYPSVTLRIWGGTSNCTVDYQIYDSISTLPVNVASSYTGVSVGEYFTIDYKSVLLRTGTYGAYDLYPTASSAADIYYKPSGSETFVIGGYAYEWQDNQLTIQYETTETTDYQVGGVGGGTQGGAYSSTYAGKQNAAGSDGVFGQGAAQSVTNYRYCSGAGGGGWYGGGGGQKSNSSMTYCKYSGGGSGFVNTAASAGNRPSGYTGLQLNSGSTVDGEQTFEAPAGGTETGHAGDGYARITRLE